MLNPLPKIIKAFAAHVPGTSLNIAQAKRSMEKRLRAEGYSKTHAVALASQHFAKRLKEH